jgi:D-3-phosphoglycerate dehydrogenase / 2-oxoglutarate reductase
VTSASKAVRAGGHLVFLRDSFSILQVPEAAQLVRDHGLTLVREVPVGQEGDVVAVVVGLSPFGVLDAQHFPNLRTVARFGAGVDNVEVAGLWRERRLPVSCTPGFSNRDVAEFALAMIILALRRAPRDITALSGEPSIWRVVDRGLGLAEATVGIVGCGNIGRETAALVAPLAAHTLLWNRSARLFNLAGVAANRYSRAGLDELVLRAHVVSVHLALNADTRGLIGEAFFDKLRAAGRSIALVNTARGDVVDEAALLRALDDRTVHAAAVDVWSAEGLRMNKTVLGLRRHPAVLPTSHIGSHTTGGLHRYAMQCARNIVALVHGHSDEVVAFVVDPGAK